ncbi:MAG: HAD family phosphatase [Pseudomonadota bacterium]
MIEAVIFDIGNVLIGWHPERYYDAAYGPERREALFEAVDLHDVNDRIDRGADFRETIYAAAEAQPEWGQEIRDWHDKWLELAGPVIEPSVELLLALRAKKFPVFALTNFGVGSFQVAEAEWGFLKEFDRRYVSGAMKTAKPDPEIYAMVEADCRVAPERLFFTDDRPENIEAAAARGWQTHLFEGTEGLAARLRSEGLLP